MRKSVVVVLGILCCGIIAMTVTITYFYNSQGPGMVLPFREVTAFSRPAQLIMVLMPHKAVLMNVSGNSGLSYSELHEPSRFSLQNLSDYGFFPGAAIAVRPNGSKFYISTADQLAEYDKTGSLSHLISIAEFRVGPGKYIFGETVQASNERLWLSVQSLPRRHSRHFVIEWQPGNDPNTREIGPEAVLWTVAPSRRQAFVFGEKTGLSDLDTNSFIEKPWNMYCFADFTEADGLLLSGVLASDKYDRVALFDLGKDSQKDITWGAQAQWGSDGYIYFKRGSTQLWRCKPDKTKPEPVYLATRVPRGGDSGIGNELKLSHDRTFLSFFYRVPHPSGEERRGLVLLGLKNKEYTDLDSETFCRLYPGPRSQKIAFVDGEIKQLEKPTKNFWFLINMAWLVTPE